MSASTRPIKLDDWGISWEEYKELTYFCLQYERKKADAAALLTTRISTPPPEVYRHGGREYGFYPPHGKGGTSDPTAVAMEKRERLLNDVRIIEKAARMAADDLAPYILRAVTTRGGVQSLFARERPPCGERQFYALRRKFYWVLRELRNGDM